MKREKKLHGEENEEREKSHKHLFLTSLSIYSMECVLIFIVVIHLSIDWIASIAFAFALANAWNWMTQRWKNKHWIENIAYAWNQNRRRKRNTLSKRCHLKIDLKNDMKKQKWEILLITINWFEHNANAIDENEIKTKIKNHKPHICSVMTKQATDKANKIANNVRWAAHSTPVLRPKCVRSKNGIAMPVYRIWLGIHGNRLRVMGFNVCASARAKL